MNDSTAAFDDRGRPRPNVQHIIRGDRNGALVSFVDDASPTSAVVEPSGASSEHVATPAPKA